jgi:large subunit ribosomal protein L14
MLWNESKVIIADNTWAKLGKVIRVKKWSNAKYATVGDVVVIAVKKAIPGGQVEEGDVVWGVVIRTTRSIKRKDGTVVRFWDNAVALINKDWEPRWKRIFGPVAREVREKGFRQLANLAEEVI